MEKTTGFRISQTEIPGLLEIEIDILEDARGFFQEKFQKKKLVDAGFPKEFTPVQHNISFNAKAGVTRGIHLEPWDKYVAVVTGKVFSVFVDLRPDNFGKKVCITIDKSKAVFVPVGVGNSFQTLVDDTFYSNMVNDHWQPNSADKYKFVNLADPDLNIPWPIPLSRAVISDKDKSHPNLKQVQPYVL